MGTWAIIENKENIKKAKDAIEKLEAIKKELYHVCGNDDLFDGLDRAIQSISEHLDSAAMRNV